MATDQTSTITLAALSAQLDPIIAALPGVTTAEGDYDDACELWERLRAVRGLMELVRARRAALWAVHQREVLGARQAAKAAARECTRLAELEADRLGSQHGSRR